MVKRESLITSYKFYKMYNQNPVEKPTYLKILSGLILFIMAKVLDGHDVRLAGDTLGKIGIRGKKVRPRLDKETGEVKGLAISWGKTRKLWADNPEAKEKDVKVYCFNEHTGGIRYKLVWIKTDMKTSNKTLYNLDFCRANSEELYRRVMAGKEYLVKADR